MSDTSLRTQVYESLRQALTTGRFEPGQKLTFRFIAGALGVSLTPVREALGRLVAEGAFEMQPNRSVRVPVMTRARIMELRDIRMALEGLAAAKAALAADRRQVAELRNIREFHFTLYGMADQPTLLRVIEGLWLQTGPYMNLLYPDFVSRPHGPQGRANIIRALQARDAAAARREIENDIDRALSYVADLADDDGNIALAKPTAAVGRRRGAAIAAQQLNYA
jgi:DNA-binding GntR family transcriptional regulator